MFIEYEEKTFHEKKVATLYKPERMIETKKVGQGELWLRVRFGMV